MSTIHIYYRSNAPEYIQQLLCLEEVLSAKLRRCGKCNMMQCLDRCIESNSAKLVVEAKEAMKSRSTTQKDHLLSSSRLSITFHCITVDLHSQWFLREICQGVVVTEEVLLTADRSTVDLLQPVDPRSPLQPANSLQTTGPNHKRISSENIICNILDIYLFHWLHLIWDPMHLSKMWVYR